MGSTIAPISCEKRARHTRLQFTLRAVFLAVLICAVIAWMAKPELERESRSGLALPTIESLGGVVQTIQSCAGTEQRINFCSIERLMLSRKKSRTRPHGDVRYLIDRERFVIPTDPDLAVLASFDNLTVLNLCDCPITDAGLRHLERLTSLQTVYLANTCVSDAGVARLKNKLPAVRIVRGTEFDSAADWERAYLGK